MRIEPGLPPAATQTHRVLAPLATHWRKATCAEVACPEYLHGWRLRVEGLEERDVHVATHCGRKWQRVPVAAGETWLVFEAGQPCFQASAHRIRIEREERFFLLGGDHRGNPRGTPPLELSAGSWTDDFGEHQDQLSTAFERG
jgi:hypothetical protein